MTSDLDCTKLKNNLSAEKDVKKYRKKMYDLVGKDLCPKSPKPNARKTHKNEIDNSTNRIQDLEDIITELGCS